MGDARCPRGTREDHDASTDASGTRPPDGGEQPHKDEKWDADWRKLIDCVTSMEGDLNKPIGQAPMAGLRRGMRDIGTQIRALWKQATCNRPTIEAKLGRLETKIDALIKGGQGNRTEAGRQTPTTWANIAALPPRVKFAPIAQRPAIRVRIPSAAEKTPEEILTAVKPVIMGAYAIK